MRKVLILFTDFFEERGIQKYNRCFLSGLKNEFPNVEFLSICLSGMHKVSFIVKAIKTVLTKKPQFLICGHVNLSPIGLFLKRICGLKYAVLTHGIECWSVKDGIKFKALKNADIITAVSKYSKNLMVMNGIPEEKIKLSHNTVNTSLFYRKPLNGELINRLDIENKRVLLTVGEANSQERYKGHDIVLEVLGKLDGEYIWLIIGGGDDFPRLEQKARDLGVLDRVRFIGKVKNERLIDYYNLCDVFIMPSKGEGFGIVFLEAMACGKPVIGGKKDGTREPLMDGQLGFVVNPDSTSEIIQAIERACKAKEDRTDPVYLTENVNTYFGIETFNRKLKNIFGDFLK